MASNGNAHPQMSHQDRLRVSGAVAVLQSPELLMRTAVKNGQSIPATRLAYEKLAAGVVDKTNGGNYRKDVTAAEDTFKPNWMNHEEKETAQQKQNGN